MLLREMFREEVEANAYEKLKAEFPNLNTVLRFVPGLMQAMAVADAASAVDMYQKTIADIERKYPNVAQTLKPDPHLDTNASPDEIASLEKEMTEEDYDLNENFADGKNPQDKGDSKRHGVPTKASVSTLRKVAKQGGRKGQLAHWMANMKSGKAKKNESLSESVIHPSTMDALQDFLPFAMEILKLEKLPRIGIHKTIQSGPQPSFGGYNPNDGSIQLALKDRHPADILRTLAHELVHFKQDQNGQLHNESGNTGSSEENEANVKAGIIMRHFNKRFPKYLE